MDTTATSYLMENEPIKQDGPTDINSYKPTDEEQKTIRMVNKLFMKSKKTRSKYDQKWADYYQMFRGKQWKEQRPSYRSSEVINMVYQAIQSFVPIMTDTRPKFEYQPENPMDLQIAQIINEVSNWDWERKNWNQIITEMLYDGHFYGTGLTRLDFDKDGDGGQGAITLETIDPFYCYPDPNAPAINHPRAKFFITAEAMDVDLIKSIYPTNGRYVKPDMQGMEQLPDKSNQKELIYKSPTDSVIITNENPQTGSNANKTILFTVFLKDDQVEENESTRVNEQGLTAPIFTQKLKYPKGRLIQMASNVILKDEEAPIEDSFFPVQKYVNYIDPREFWGLSEVEQLESPQKLFNKTLSFAMDVMNLMGNPVWIVDSGCVDADNLVNKPGLVIEKDHGSEVRREQGVPLQPFVSDLLQKFRDYHDGVSGSQDVTRGVNPTGVTAASAISDLQQASQTRIRLKSRNLDAYLQDLGQHYLSYVFQNYTIPRIVRVTSKDDPKLTTYFKFHVEHKEVNGENQRVAKVRRFQEGQNGGHTLGDEETYEVNGKFDIKVATGSTLPFSKNEKRAELFDLFDRKIIDGVEVLKGIDYPNYEAVLERMQQVMAEQAQSQQTNPSPPQQGQ